MSYEINIQGKWELGMSDEQNKKIEEQEKALLQYKDHMRDSQKRQWDKLDEHEKTLQQVSHALEMCKQEHEKE